MKSLLLVATLIGTLFLSGCAAFSDDAGSSGSGLTVVAAHYPLQYVAQRVSGSRAEVTNLTKPGSEPHDLEIPPKETAGIIDADLVLYQSRFQPAVDDTVDQNSGAEIIDAAEVADLRPVDDKSLDPHFWQDPLRMAEVGDAVAERLSKIDPAHADEFSASSKELRADLEALDQDFQTGLSSCRRSTVVVSHDAFGYLAKYGLDMEPIAGLSPGAEPTPADLIRLQKLIRSDGITTVFSERLVSPRLSQSLADDMSVRTAVLDPLEGLSDQTAEEDYLSLMEQNLTALKKANACQ